MGRLLGGLGAIIAYFCIGTVLAGALGFGPDGKIYVGVGDDAAG